AKRTVSIQSLGFCAQVRKVLWVSPVGKRECQPDVYFPSVRMRSPTPGTGLACILNVLFGTLLGKERNRDTTLGLRAEVIPGRTRQLHDLVGLVVSQLGFVKLLGRFVQRSNARLFRVFLALMASASLVHPQIV